MKISKRLLSVITNISESNLKKVKYGNSLLEVTKSNDTWIEYNIYEIAFECKKWAIKNGYSINSERFLECVLKDGKQLKNYKGIAKLLKNYEHSYEKIFAHTEVEAIFEACEIILDEIDKEREEIKSLLNEIENEKIVKKMLCEALLSIDISELSKMGYYGEDIKKARDYAIEYLKNNHSKENDKRKTKEQSPELLKKHLNTFNL